jgi:hypothetical protein
MNHRIKTPFLSLRLTDKIQITCSRADLRAICHALCIASKSNRAFLFGRRPGIKYQTKESTTIGSMNSFSHVYMSIPCAILLVAVLPGKNHRDAQGFRITNTNLCPGSYPRFIVAAACIYQTNGLSAGYVVIASTGDARFITKIR